MPALQTIPSPVYKKDAEGRETKEILAPGLRDIFIPHKGNYLVKSDYCLDENTKVKTVLGPKTIKDIQENDLVYGYDYTTGKPNIVKVLKKKNTGIKKTMKIILDSGAIVRTTPEHKWIDLNGDVVLAKDLTVGHRLLPYRESFAGPQKRKTLYVHSNRNYVYEHRAIAEFLYGKISKEDHVHHIDGDCYNNHPSNLEIKNKTKHLSEHGKIIAKNCWANPTCREAMCKGISESIKKRGGYYGKNNPNYGNRKGKVKKCLTCEKEFYTYPSSKDKKFCSRSCYTKSRNHKVKEIIYDNLYVQTYDIEVSGAHIFALDAGVYVHNSQLELRLTAYMCNDLPLIKAYESGVDVHNQNAHDLFPFLEIIQKGDRKLAKRFVYAANYRAQALRVWRSLLIDFPDLSLEFVEGMLERWFDVHFMIVKTQDKWIRKAASNKYGYVENPLNGVRQYYFGGKVNEQEIANFPNQSAGAHIIDEAIIELNKYINWKDEAILAQVHDELIVEGPDVLKLFDALTKSMVRTYTINNREVTFPIDVSVGKSWAVTKEFTREELIQCLAWCAKGYCPWRDEKNKKCQFNKRNQCQLLNV